MPRYRALIKTHHMTSRKKISAIKTASERLGCHALLRVGGSPGVMFVEGEELGVRGWVSIVHDLRYKDYQLLVRPELMTAESGNAWQKGWVEEVGSLKEFRDKMGEKGMTAWWDSKMGFSRRGSD